MILAASLAETFTFYVKAHIFHWNVVGPAFPSYHELFGEIYSDAHSAVDALAEHIRAAGDFAPGSLKELTSPASISFSSVSDALAMVRQLASDNDKVISALRADLTKSTNPGLSNFLQDRIDMHNKWSWMLRATAGVTTKKSLLDE